MARTLGSLWWALLWLSAACLPAVGPAAPSAYVQVLSLEQARSLGGGALAADLDAKDERLAVRAALAIGRSKRQAGETALVAHLRDPRAAVRAMSLYGIGLIASGRSASAILNGLADPNGAVRIAALDATDRYEAAQRFPGRADLSALDRTLGLLAGDPDPTVRARAAATLESFYFSAGADSAARGLVRAVGTDTSEHVRRFAMWTIFRGYATLVPRAFLANMLRDRDEVVRIEAVRAVGKRRNASDVALVQPMLGDPSWRVQEQAAETIRVLQGKSMTQHWTAIPPFMHIPPMRADPLRSLPALPRVHLSGRPGRPSPSRAILEPKLDPSTAQAMSAPAHGSHPRVRIVTTKGNLYVVLFPEWAPLTVENFLNLADRGYYDRNRWFRIVPDFVVQTGDPNDNGNGDAGYSIGAEENPIMQDSYVISMGMNYTDPPNAHAIRDSAGTQYYVTLSPQLHLDRDFTVFGEVTGGFDVLGRLIESDRVLRIERVPDETL
ncbi:MAG TPA: peptidylprolyl isomerase [Candidatus Tyrphobacter sp.]